MKKLFIKKAILLFVLYILIFIISSTCTDTTIGTGQANQYSGTHNYPLALKKALFFYGAQRCGESDSWLHQSCHLEDGKIDNLNLDLSGGWHDAGDYSKFGHTNGYSAALMLMAFYHSPSAFADSYSAKNSAPPANTIPDVLDEVKILTDYLIKAASVEGKIYFQVSNSKLDHKSFSEPVYQSFSGQENGGDARKVYSVSEGASNVMGLATAALSLMSIAYSDTAKSYYNETYANECLAAAKKYYTIGKINPASITSADDASADDIAYPADNWADAMAWGAVELYRATDDETYLNEAMDFQEDSNFKEAPYYGLNHEQVEALVNYELYEITKEKKYIAEIKTEIDFYYENMKSCGYVHLNDWGSIPAAANAAYLAFLYYDATEDEKAYNFAKQNIDFILGSHNDLGGDAPAGFSFLIGYNEMGGSYPKYPHHAAAFGRGEDAWDMEDMEAEKPGSVKFAHVLTGGLVGGPQKACSKYEDNIGNYISNEVTIDYNSGLVAALAYLIKK